MSFNRNNDIILSSTNQINDPVVHSDVTLRSSTHFGARRRHLPGVTCFSVRERKCFFFNNVFHKIIDTKAARSAYIKQRALGPS